MTSCITFFRTLINTLQLKCIYLSAWQITLEQARIMGQQNRQTQEIPAYFQEAITQSISIFDKFNFII